MAGLRLGFCLEDTIIRDLTKPPINMSVQALQLLKEQGDKLFFTSEKKITEFKNIERWLDKYIVKYDGIFIGEDKWVIIEHWNLDLYVDKNNFTNWADLYKKIEIIRRLPPCYL